MNDISESERRVVDGTAWDEFCDQLKVLGKQIQRPETPGNSLDKAEGYRYLTRLLRGGLESIMEAGTAEYPVLRGLGHMVKMGADNPDNIYQGCALKGCYKYRISGTRGSVHYLGFSTISGSYGSSASMTTDGFLDADDLDVDSDGSFEIILSEVRQPGNWLPMTEATRSINIRQTFLDRETETAAQLNIERIDASTRPEIFSADKLDMNLSRLTQYLHGTVKLFADWSASFTPNINTLPAADQAYCQSIGGDPNIYYFHSYWELGEDEVLEIRARRIPECTTWNFQLDNYWLESLDYRYHQVTINKCTAKYEDDGSVIVYIAHSDPGQGNWIDTAGHQLGTMCWRWIGTEDHPDLETRVLRHSEL
ncbi:MAG: hypothetical protein ACI9GW_003232 [Halieaceae bacterium]|jgi:hypothetical protein